MKRLCACMILLVVILQAFFVPVFADEPEEGVEISLSNTALWQDFGLSLLNYHTQFDSQVLGGSFGSSQPNVWEILTSAIERRVGYVDFYLYVFNRRLSNLYSNFRITLVGASESDLTTYAPSVLDYTEHCAKLKLTLPESSQYIKTADGEMKIEIYSIGFGNDTQRPFYSEFDGGTSTSNLGLIYDLSSNRLSKREIGEKLELNVTMMDDRFSSGASLNSWKQLNTAAFLVPNSYFERFGDLWLVHFVYDLYSDVPMLVLEKTSDVLPYLSSLFDETDSDYNYIPCPSYSSQSYFYSNPFFVDDSYDSSLPGGLDHGVPTYEFLDFSRYFVFPKDYIIHQSDSGFDFVPEEALRHFNYAKSLWQLKLYAPRITTGDPTVYLKDLLKASSFEHFNMSLTKENLWTTTSFSDSTNWFTRLLFGVFPWDDVEDDSLDGLRAIQIVDSDPSGLSDSEISSTYKVDSYFASSFRHLWNRSVSSDSKMVLLRFSMTDYRVDDIDLLHSIDSNSVLPVDGYVCKNAIIDNFQIIEFEFRKTVMTDDGPVVIVTTVPVDMDPISYIGGGQSPENIEEEIVDHKNPFTFLSDFFKKANDGIDWLKRILAIVGVVISLIVLFKVITLIVSVAALLKRRKNRTDDPPRVQKRRKKRDRK